MPLRLESDISRITAKVAISCRLNFPTNFCVVWATVNMERFLINSGTQLYNVAKYELFMCNLRRLETTSIFGTNDVICHVIWRNLSFLPYQLSIFDDVGGWQPCSRSGSGTVMFLKSLFRVVSKKRKKRPSVHESGQRNYAVTKMPRFVWTGLKLLD